MNHTTTAIIAHLIKEVAKGNKTAFEELYELTYSHTYRFVSYFMDHSSDCEDVISEVYYNIWNNRSCLASVKNAKSYMYSIARYEVYKQLRVNKKNKCMSIDDLNVELTNKVQQAHDDLEEKEILLIIAQAIDSLPKQCKLIYVMVREENMKYSDVAEALNLAEGTIKQHMYQANLKIQRFIKERIEL